ncbi:MAG TPA: radical SAM protein [Phycisphaerae bacterium]|nr:radical SAM protein [Phycisphaerae bacterium]
MVRTDPSEPMPVKYWSFGGLILTYWCSARCASCYLRCGPDRREQMSVDFALAVWRGLIEASPHGCRIHLSGGEPFGDWPHLLDLARGGRREGLGPLQKVETSALWATDEAQVRRRVRALGEAGMERLVISTDPYHQQYVPIERPRMAARVAEQVLGSGRVQVRWRDWLREGCDTDRLGAAQRKQLFAEYAAKGRDRMTGRAADRLAPHLQLKPAQEFADLPCSAALLRSRHVHVDPAGRVFPGTCAGIVLGTVRDDSVESIWRRLEADHAERAILGPLASAGPYALMREARQHGFQPRPGYASKCHLCWDIRRRLASRAEHAGELAPLGLYEAETPASSGTAKALDP